MGSVLKVKDYKKLAEKKNSFFKEKKQITPSQVQA